ncbi:hypothetical protein BKA70DRAFT_1427712 [Coprinopsis sp. MPI-PUGE-AT-0042]|nr:hypothetical protein BKA70DRAFT_1427712 [Coprinopsis sp. MPI-PUGE-AT-0042]
MAPGAPVTRVWMDIWRDFVSAERQTKGFGSNGTGNATIFLFRFNHSHSHPEVCSTPTAHQKYRQTHSEHQSSPYLLHSLERPFQIGISRSLAYASHVLENAKSPALLEPIDDSPAPLRPSRLRSFASLGVKLLAPLQ